MAAPAEHGPYNVLAELEGRIRRGPRTPIPATDVFGMAEYYADKFAMKAVPAYLVLYYLGQARPSDDEILKTKTKWKLIPQEVALTDVSLVPKDGWFLLVNETPAAAVAAPAALAAAGADGAAPPAVEAETKESLARIEAAIARLSVGAPEHMSAVSGDKLTWKMDEYKRAPRVICEGSLNVTETFNWRDADGKVKNERSNHPELQRLLNSYLLPAGFIVLLASTDKGSLQYTSYTNFVTRSECPVTGYGDGYIFKITAELNDKVKAGGDLLNDALAVVEWKTEATIGDSCSYAQLGFEVFAAGEHCCGDRRPMLGLLTDHASAAALFAFSAEEQAFQCFGCASKPACFPESDHLIPLGHALKQLLEWLQAPYHPRAVERLAGVPEHPGGDGDEDEEAGERKPATKERTTPDVAVRSASASGIGGSIGASTTSTSSTAAFPPVDKAHLARLASEIMTRTGGRVHAPLSKMADDSAWKPCLPARWLHMLELMPASA